jgi:Large polyvalent protein-associated domain 7
MDEDHPSDHRADHRATPTRGGTVEPALAKDRFQTTDAEPIERSERFELRDPFFDVTYRAKSFDEMRTKAEQMGASRFTAIDRDGSRTPVQKINGEWQRGEPLPALPQRPADPMTTRDDVPDLASQSSGSVAGTAASNTKAPDKAAAKAIAKIDADAERAAMVARIESSLAERYVIKRAPVMVGDMKIGSTEYRFRGDSSRVAFTESTFRLATDTNSPTVARSMVDLAQARDWKGLRVSGAEDFRRMVWLEASVRGVKSIGYEPNEADLDLLRREREARQTNRIEPTRDLGSSDATVSPEKSSARGGGRKTVIAAIDAILIAKRVPEAKRQAVLAAATEQLARSATVPKIKVYDRSAERHMPIPPPAPDLNRAQDRAAPTRTR